MNFSTWSIRNPIPGVLLFVMLTGLGLLSFQSMKIQNFPDIDLPTIVVRSSLPGASPSQLENEVARRIEDSIANVQGLKHVHSLIQDGSVVTTAEFRLERSTSDALDDVRDAISRVRADLPQDLREPVISKLEIAGAPILSFAVDAASMDEEALSWFVDHDVSKALMSVPGVGKVTRTGGVTREVRVELDPVRMLALNVTAAEVSRQLRLVQQESAGGRADVGGVEQSIRTLATVKTARELAAMDIPLRDGRHVRLDQVANVIDTFAERRSAALFDGKPAVGFEVSRSRGAGEVDVEQGVHARLDELRRAHPGMRIINAFDMVSPVRENYAGSMYLLFEGALLAVIVVWVFLRDWRATLVAATALPLSIIPTFAGMAAMGFSLNMVTLLALALVVGILVDDAIVEIENIVRHLTQGKSPQEAAMEAVEEIGLAVVATTFTLVAVFLPTAFMAGVAGKFFVQFGWTAAISVMASLLVARLLTPMMAAYFLRPIAHEHRDGPVMKRYLGWVAWCLRHRVVTSVAAIAFFIGSLLLIPLLPSGFIPPDDLSQTQVTLELPPGSGLNQTLAAAETARQMLVKIDGVQQIFTTIGSGTAGSDPFQPGAAPEARKAAMLVSLTPRHDRSLSKQQIESMMRDAMAHVPGVRATVGFGGVGEQLSVALTGDNGPELLATARQVLRDLRTIPGIGNVTSTAALQRPELVIRPNAERAADLGVTASAIAETVRVATAGDYDQNLAKLNLDQRQVPISVRLPESARADIDLIRQLSVPGRGGNVPLQSVADAAIESGPAMINRYDRSRNVVFTIELNGRQLGDVLAQVDRLPSLTQLPGSVRRAELGDVESMNELFSSFGLAMLIGVGCIYAVLVLLFRDFLQPVTILAALPLSLGGAFAALLIAGKSMSMPSLIGLIMLMGVATKNSILLVEYAIMARREHGMGRTEALLDACHKRARPIIMTTIAMGAGMVPIAVGIGVDPSFRSPMAVAVIGGLVTSTVLSLFVIPVVFTYIDDLMNWLRRRFVQRTPSPPDRVSPSDSASISP